MRTTIYPEMAWIKQKLNDTKLLNIEDCIHQQINALSIQNKIQKGESVALAVGSRGIHDIDHVVKSCISILKHYDLKPVIIPAMGSHGGATSEGQMAVLEKLSITKQSMGCDIDADMGVTILTQTASDVPIYFSKRALEANHIVVINRVKPHTKFSAPIESGLCKMLTIGLGKKKGAELFHQAAVNHSFHLIEQCAELIITKCPILFGVAILENGYGQLASIDIVLPEQLIEQEKKLLQKAYQMIGQIPFDPIDILIIDYIGKNISGIGMDSNVTGRHRDIVGNFFHPPHVKRIFVRDLTPESQGNANGIGLADVTTTRCVNAIDRTKTYINAITALSPEKAAIPMFFDTDQECVDVCLQTIGLNSFDQAKIVKINNTMTLDRMLVSRALENEIQQNLLLEQMTPWTALTFMDGQLIC